MREKTSSVTQLVKIIANEVFDERIKEFILSSNAEEAIKNVQSTLEQAGRPWEEGEEQLLTSEFNMALAQIAKNHSRSVGAIRAKIKVRLRSETL